jgi:hypothetical protein
MRRPNRIVERIAESCCGGFLLVCAAFAWGPDNNEIAAAVAFTGVGMIAHAWGYFW